MAKVVGLEPTASGFGDRRSDQLSYTDAEGMKKPAHLPVAGALNSNRIYLPCFRAQHKPYLDVTPCNIPLDVDVTDSYIRSHEADPVRPLSPQDAPLDAREHVGSDRIEG